MALPTAVGAATIVDDVTEKGVRRRLLPDGVERIELRRHYLAAAALFVGLAFLGTLGVTPSVRRMLFDAAIGVALAIVGIGDHQLLTATLEEVHAYV